MSNLDLLHIPGSAPNAQGGTELMARRLYERLPRELLEQTQMIFTRLGDIVLDDTKIRIAYIHDLPGDPELNYLNNGGWSKFHRLVFVSNWQMQQFINHYKIPWSKCVVIKNGIVPIEAHTKPDAKDVTRLIYTSTPHRGLGILAGAFFELCKDKSLGKLELEVFSSFDLYGWPDRDAPFKSLFDDLKNHPNVVYHGAKPNDEIREAIKRSHIFAYPSVWAETSCLCLIEAMSGGLICVHPNLAALYETAGNMTAMYQFHENPQTHVNIFLNLLRGAIQFARADESKAQLSTQMSYTNLFYNIDKVCVEWTHLLSGLMNEPREIRGPVTVIRTEDMLPRF